MNVCTIVAKNYLAHARVLARSLAAQHPESQLTVLVLDSLEGYVDPADEPYRLWGPDDLECEPFDEMVNAYSVIELSTAVKPWLLRRLLTEQDHAVYLDPDIRVVSPLDEIRELAVEHGIVLTPHNLTPIPRDGRYPSEESILIAGAYNLGFIGLGRGDAADELLDWWSERLATDCVVDPGSGRFVDQKWIDLVPGIWPDTHILHDPTYNIAYWNLHARTLEVDDPRRPTIDGRPVRFLHFSGFSPDRPDELSKHQDRIVLDERPDVRAICDVYGAELVEQGYHEASKWPYGLASPAAGHAAGGGLDGVNVVGYLTAELGVGEVARQAIGALDAVGVPTIPVGIPSGVNREGHDFEHASHAYGPFSTNLVCVNADMLPTVAGQLGPEFFEGRGTVGWWWWETDELPERWHGSFDLVDEVWAGSRFVAEALAKVSPVPVAHIPTPVTMRPGVVADRAAVGLPEGFVFLFSFDFNSVVARKNPAGLIEAFKRAFPEPREGVTLVLKSINGDRHPEAVAALSESFAGRDDIVLRDEYLDAELRDVLVASCDCYVSLHRSEGFGFTLAEAMLLGKPVVGVAYSGSADYLSDETGFVVRHELVRIGEGADPYPADGRWAEPDLDHAAQLLVQVVDDPEEARRRAERGQAFIKRHHSPAAAGLAMARRLSRLVEGQDVADVLDPPKFQEAQDARTNTLNAIQAPAPAPLSAPGRALDRATQRLLRRATGHRRDLDQALWWSVESSAAAAQQALADHGQRLGRLEAYVTAARLAESRRVAELRALQNGLSGEVAATRDGLAELEDALRPGSEVEDAALTRFEADGAGRVIGFEGGGAEAGADAAEALRARRRRYDTLLEGVTPVLDVGPALGDGDAVAALEGLDEGSQGAVVALALVERLDEDALRRLLAAAHRALRPGGRLVLESVNPHSPRALHAFWADLDRTRPVFPEALLTLCRDAGFASGYAFAPEGTGDWDADRGDSDEYAVVATR
ncbi:MAG TPA: glycosyltransferase [Baekduia sp.]|uniref:glycosyltransferase n=1 Tax=Baekduia sp. TaxID=2600305 RepID=UPI002D76B0A8|nr:glycosyltransferase [Baekduia sp.]HET6509490.1 glycosyltransferase [Baekduia sp.]